MKKAKIHESSDLFMCPQSPMLIKISIEVLGKPRKRSKKGCEVCNDIAAKWLISEIQRAFASIKKLDKRRISG